MIDQSHSVLAEVQGVLFKENGVLYLKKRIDLIFDLGRYSQVSDDFG
jgi:hypothetical protein